MNNKYKSAEDYIKVPLQSKWYNGRRVYAYLRRSTSKEEQSESLLQQEEWITFIASQLGIEIKEIVFFEETRSGFENRSRPEWKKLLKAVDMSPEWAIILCRDTSRLSRNPRDNMEIADRIFGDNKKKKKIISIFFLSGNQLQEWNERSDKKYIVDKLHQNYTESIETKQKSLSGIILKLQQWIYPYNPPKWLYKYEQFWKWKILRQNDDMWAIRRAFEMKASGEAHTRITKFLLQNGIRICHKELSNVLFKNPIYIGQYTEKNTGEFFDNIVFYEWKPPISMELWQKVQDTFKGRKSQYGKKFENDVIARLLRTNTGRRMTPYIPSGKTAKQYKNTLEKIHISERVILREFMKVVRRMIIVWLQEYKKISRLIVSSIVESRWITLEKIQQDMENFEWKTISDKEACMLTEIMQKPYNDLKNPMQSLVPNVEYREKEKQALKDMIREMEKTQWDGVCLPEEYLEMITEWVMMIEHFKKEKSIEYITEALKNSRVFQEKQKLQENIQKEVLWFQKEKEKLEQDRKTIIKNAMLKGWEQDMVDEILEDNKNAIRIVEEKILELWEQNEYEKFLHALPDILAEIFELSVSALSKEENEGKKENILKLLELTTFELSVDNKKELKIQLFEVIETLLKGGLSGLEAPAGVEPASKALQASV